MSGVPEFPPSERRLRELRKLGSVPQSREVLSAAVVLGSCAGGALFLLLVKGALVSFSQTAFASSAEGLPASELFSLVQTAAALTFRAVLIVVGAVLLLVVGIGLLQTRFLFSVSAIQFSLSSMFRWGNNLLAPLSNLARSLFRVLLPGVAIIVAGAICVRSIVLALFSDEYVAQRLSFAQTTSIAWGEFQLVGLVLAAIVGIHLVVAVTAYFLAQLAFMREHRMSRAELEAEARETEMSSEMRGALRDLQRE